MRFINVGSLLHIVITRCVTLKLRGFTHDASSCAKPWRTHEATVCDPRRAVNGPLTQCHTASKISLPRPRLPRYVTPPPAGSLPGGGERSGGQQKVLKPVRRGRELCRRADTPRPAPLPARRGLPAGPRGRGFRGAGGGLHKPPEAPCSSGSAFMSTCRPHCSLIEASGGEEEVARYPGDQERWRWLPGNG